ncbi:hypothetical protein Tsubulata_007758 [Turnera subulata]|uniref:Phytocyanin domain-containing protein n=1 Tax=Turnera subulata TaxID=218843 RepID=A0A9Q0FZ67_9ROSI|nr:hypothetical protein Tsubulata_007758 [Turnera subulata]
MGASTMHGIEAEEHDVGGEIGWQNPSNTSFYSAWASTHNFSSAYDSCTTANPSNILRTGPATVTLNTTGMHYYLCTFDSHCSAGQKLAINVTGSSPSTPAPGPGGSSTPSGNSTPPPSSAASLTAATFALMFLSIAMSFIHSPFLMREHRAQASQIIIILLATANTTEHKSKTRATGGDLFPWRTQNKKMARRSNMVGFLAAVFLATLLHSSMAQTTHVVGGSLNWVIPPGGASAYTTWAANQTFNVGDILVFNFANGVHDVTEVTKSDYDNCNTAGSPISQISTSPARITLNSTGDHYFFCSFPGHCAAGQKLAINVTSAASTNNSSPAPQPSPPTSTPAPQPSTAPPVSNPSPSPAPSGSAPSPAAVPASSPAPTPVANAPSPTGTAPSPTGSAPTPAGGAGTPPSTTPGATTPSSTGVPPTSATSPPPPDSAASLGVPAISATFLAVFVALSGTFCTLAGRVDLKNTRNMANRLGLIGFLIVALALIEAATRATATTYTIGGSTGWAVPPNTSFYEEWVKDKTFKIGDSYLTGKEFTMYLTHQRQTMTTAQKQMGFLREQVQMSCVGLLIVALASLEGANAATTYTVGDSLGWRVPPSNSTGFYDEWIGDSVVFNWTGTHTATEVAGKEAYDNCTKTGLIHVTSGVKITYHQNGTFYYVCNVGTHCEEGQKVTIKVGNGIAPQGSAATPSSLASGALVASLSAIRNGTMGGLIRIMSCVGLLIVAVLALLEGANAATTYTVGDSLGWRVPPSNSTGFYDEWASNKAFQIGDSVVFNWTGTRTHTATLVSKEEYDNCTKTTGLIFSTRVTFTYDENGTFYYVCNVGTHCEQGQKVTIKIGNGIASAATPSSLASGALVAFLSAIVLFLFNLL